MNTNHHSNKRPIHAVLRFHILDSRSGFNGKKRTCFKGVVPFHGITAQNF